MILSGVHVCYSTGREGEKLHDFQARAELAARTHILRLRRRRSLGTLTAAAALLAEKLRNLSRHPEDAAL